jgi:demethylmenaquinone methyltransferase/2-methoxy-6-polyprenyl-1,4-benzoquinol methylase
LTKKGGKIFVLEFSWPKNIFLAKGYNLYFKYILPWIGNLFSGHKDAYTYLNRTVETFPYGSAFLELMAEAGYKNLKATPLTFGVATLYEGTVN